MAVAETRAREAIECAKVEAVAVVGSVALAEVASLSVQEAALAARCPRATARLAFIADEETLAIGTRLQCFGRSLG